MAAAAAAAEWDNNDAVEELERMVDGTIISVELINFMTLRDIKYVVHPKFNVLVGINEYEKASVFTALLLGFGRSSKDANGEENVGKYIKRGEHFATITIELYMASTKTNVILSRKLYAYDSSSTYIIDKAIVTRSEYVKLLADLNIKARNVGQFLIQDKLNSISLFPSALQCTENNQTFKTFKKLRRMAAFITKSSEDMSKLQSNIAKTNTNISTLKLKINSLSEDQLLECDLVDLLQRKSWLLYEMIMKVIRDETIKLNSAHSSNLCALNCINQYRSIIETIIDFLVDKFLMHRAHVEHVLWPEFFRDISNIKFHVFEMQDLQKCIRINLKRKTELQVSIFLTNEAFEKMENETFCAEDYKQELIGINESLTNSGENLDLLTSRFKEIDVEMKEYTSKFTLDERVIENEKIKEREKINFLSCKYPEILKAIRWLRNCDKTVFRGQVLEPMFSQIKVLKKDNAKYIHNIIDNVHLKSFVFEYKSDSRIFNRVAERKRWNNIRSIIIPLSSHQVNDTPTNDIDSLRRFGFHSYAINTIETPPIIRRFLITTYNMHNILIGSEEVFKNINDLPSCIKHFYAGHFRCFRTVHGTVDRIRINDSFLFAFYADYNLIQSMVEKHEKDKIEIESVKDVRIDYMNRIKTYKTDYRYDLARQKNVSKIISLSELDPDNFKCCLKEDIGHNKSELEKSTVRENFLISINMRMTESYFKSMENLVDLLEAYAEHMKLFVAMVFVLNNGRNKSKTELVVEKIKTHFKHNMKNIYNYMNYINCLESEFMKRERNALYWSQGGKLYGTCYQQMYDNLHQIDQYNVEMLDKLIAEKKTKLISPRIRIQFPTLFKEYNEGKMELKEMEKKYEDLSNCMELKKNKMERMHVKWFSDVQELCSLLNTNFQRFLTSFGCNGLVGLHIGGSQYDYDKYGLSISAQFSDNTSLLTLLGDNIPTGSESSVFTNLLFWYTLQDNVRFPFRVIGKIKRDMDQSFERNLIEMLMTFFENKTKLQNVFFIKPELFEEIRHGNVVGNIMFSVEN